MDRLIPIVYDELRRLAQHLMRDERAGHTLQATALVHEAYIRLVDQETARHWNSRGHFFAAAARRLLSVSTATRPRANDDPLLLE